MELWELSILSGVGIVMAVMLGFLIGMSYQSLEDKRYIRKLKAEYDSHTKKILDMKGDYITKAYKMGRQHQKEIFEKEVNSDWMRFVATIGNDDDNDIKIGGF